MQPHHSLAADEHRNDLVRAYRRTSSEAQPSWARYQRSWRTLQPRIPGWSEEASETQRSARVHPVVGILFELRRRVIPRGRRLLVGVWDTLALKVSRCQSSSRSAASSQVARNLRVADDFVLRSRFSSDTHQGSDVRLLSHGRSTVNISSAHSAAKLQVGPCPFVSLCEQSTQLV